MPRVVPADQCFHADRQSLAEADLGLIVEFELVAAFQGSDRFLALDYKRDFEGVRQVANSSGEVKKKGGTP